MSDIPKQLTEIADALHKGEAPSSETVRTLLSWFGAQRRRYSAVENIRRSLDQLGIKTDPDFELTYIDAPIRFVLRTEEQKTIPTSRTDFQDQPPPPGETTPIEIVPVPDSYLPGWNASFGQPHTFIREAYGELARGYHDHATLRLLPASCDGN